MDIPDTFAEARTRRITVYGTGTGPDAEPVREFAATPTDAWEFVTAATLSGLAVTIDGRVRPGLRALPARRHWRNP